MGVIGKIIFRIKKVFSCSPFIVVSDELEYLPVNYGYLYNWYTVDDARNIANTGWEIPNDTKWITLRNYLSVGDRFTNVSGGLMKETGTTYWNNPNTGATNTSNFNARGTGRRTVTGTYTITKELCWFWNPRSSSGNGGIAVIVYDDDNLDTVLGSVTDKIQGASIRLMKTITTLSDGETSTYTGNDGKVYRTICIGTQEWLADNLVETKYRNLDAIPEITNDATWAGLSTGARCSYDNDESNAI